MLKTFRCCTAGLVMALLGSLPAFATVDKTVTTVTEGWVPTARHIYSYTVTSTGAAMFNDIHIRFNRSDLLDLSSASENDPAASTHSIESVAGCPYPCGELVFRTANPLGFAPPTAPTTFTVETTANPKYIEPSQPVRYTLNGNPLTSDITTSPVHGIHVPFSTTMTFGPGTFSPGATIDLLQSTSLPAEDVFLGTSTASGTGSALIPLSRPLTYDPVFVSIDAASGFMTTIAGPPTVPLLGSWGMALLALGLGLVAILVLRPRRRSA